MITSTNHGKKKGFQPDKFKRVFFSSASSTITTKIVAVGNNMPLERPGTGSANPSAHSDPVLAKRRIARNVLLQERGSLCE